MLYGDISNEPAPSVGVRFEEIIRSSTGKLNRSGKAFLERMGSYDVQVVLFTTGSDRKAQAYCYKWAVPYSRVLSIDSILELIQVAIEHKLLQYWDTDRDILAKINERHRGTETKLWTLAQDLYLG